MSKKENIQGEGRIKKCVIKCEHSIEIHLEVGHTKKEWKNAKKNAENNWVDLWSFPIDEMLNGAIHPDEGRIYWLIDGRLYETESFL